MNLDEFEFNHECLIPFVSLKRSIEEDNKYSDKDSFEDRILKDNAVLVGIKKIIESLFDKMYSVNIKLTLKDIFEITDEVIDDLYYLSNLKVNNEREKRPSVAIFLMNFFKRSDHKYLGSPCFLVNMSCIEDFQEAISIFNMKKISVNENLMNITGRNSSNTFISPIGITDEKFKPENIDICFYLIKKIIRVCNLFTLLTLSFREIKCLYLELDFKSTNGLFNVNLSLNRLLDNLSSLSSETPLQKSFSEFISLIVTEPKNITESFKRVLEICSFKWSIVEKFINEFKQNVFFNPYFLIIKKCQFLYNITEEKSEEFIETIVYLMKKQNNQLIIDFSQILVGIVEIFKKNHCGIIANYLKRDYLISMYEFSNYIYVDINFLNFYLSFPYDDDILELLYLLFLIKGSKVNGDVAVDCLSLLLSIKTDNITLDEIDDKLFFEGSNVGRYLICKRDNFLFCRIARLFLYRDMFTGLREFDLLSEGCDCSILLHLPHSKIKISKVREFYNQTINVHSSNRDENTKRIYERFLGLNSYGEFIIQSTDTVTDPWKILDDIRSEEKNDEEYQGTLSKSEINHLFNEFWMECKNKITDESEIQSFFRVMGVNFEMEPIKRKSKDFGGFFIDGTYIRGTNIDQKLILAHLWNFCKKNSHEGLCDVMINSYKIMIQSKKDKDSTIFDYCVCNDGKLQYFACSILQGRIRDENFEIMTIDKENKTIINDTTTEINPSQMYVLLKPFYDAVSEEGNIQKDCNEMFRIFFSYIKENNLGENIKLAIETLCLYSEGINGFVVNPDFALPLLFTGCFDIDDYTLIKNHIDTRLDIDRNFIDPDDPDEYYDLDPYWF